MGTLQKKIQKIRLENGVYRSKTKEERIPHKTIQRFIEKNQGEMSDCEMANELGYALEGFRRIKRDLGFMVHSYTRKRPNPKLDSLILKNWNDKTDKEIAAMISDKLPPYVVRHRRKRLGIKK